MQPTKCKVLKVALICINLSSPYEVSTNYNSQYTSEENRPQRSYAGCSRSHGQEVGKPEIKPEHPKPMFYPMLYQSI